MKMKKIICSLMISVLCFITAISGVSAASYDTSKIDQAYAKIIEYYKNNNTLVDADKIIAVESLGLEAESNQFDISSIDLEKVTDSKRIIVKALLGIDPTEDKIALENKIDEQGNVEGSYGTSSDVWTLLALYVTNSNKVELLANKLSDELNEKEVFGYTYNGVEYKDYDTTSWVIGTLSLVNKEKYETSLDKSINNIKTNTELLNTGWVSDGNIDTQACVLEALLINDKNDLLNGEYSKHPMDCILASQQSDGSFPSFYDKTYTTAEVAKTLGTYENGSVFEKAKKAYNAITNPVKEEPKTEPTTPAEPKKDTTPTQTTTPAQTDKKATAVKTGDNTNVVAYVSLSMMSAGLFLVLKKEYERAH